MIYSQVTKITTTSTVEVANVALVPRFPNLGTFFFPSISRVILPSHYFEVPFGMVVLFYET